VNYPPELEDGKEPQVSITAFELMNEMVFSNEPTLRAGTSAFICTTNEWNAR
jgi:hypothetical protein